MSQLGPGSRVARTWGKTQSRDTETTRGSIRCGPAKAAVATVDAYLQYHSATGEVQLSDYINIVRNEMKMRKLDQILGESDKV